MRFGTQSLIQQAVSLPSSGADSRVLVVQDVRDQDAPAAAEVSATLKLLSSTMVVRRPSPQ